jgi:polyphosphate kinase
VDLADARLYINRELSSLAWNERVLEEAMDRGLPIYERLRFLSIVAANLDEFFMVRVAGLKQQLSVGIAETAADGMLPAEQLAAISERTHALVERKYQVWRELVPALDHHGVAILRYADLSPEQKTAARAHFTSQVFPALTPLAVDPGHPFPQLRNKSLNLAVLLRKIVETARGRRRKHRLGHESSLAVVQVPSVMSRLVPVPPAPEKHLAFVLLGDVIAANANDLFPGFAVQQTAVFRVTRNWDLHLDEEDSEDLLSTIQAELRRRERGAAVRLELDAAATPELERALAGPLKVTPSDVYRINGPIQLSDLSALAEADLRPELHAAPHVPLVRPGLREGDSMFGTIAAGDVLLHHPYESYDPVVRFVAEAADDPDVLAIKMTLYRTSGDSPFVRALSRAAERGKQVAVLVEIKARFDEAQNIRWARRLEENGVHVVYGLVGLKTHCKVTQVVRREGTRIRRYMHIGTGNYNPTTARQYTDLSLFTARDEAADDVTALFNMLTGFADAPRWKRLAVAPLGLGDRIVELINREAEKARRGDPARIVAKVNSLVDPAVIRALYGASNAGVPVDLLIRGICCLRPGVPGISERIRVTAIVDRFLEHARVFVFGDEVFLSSADWMPRNFIRRVEIMAAIDDPALRARVLQEVIGLSLADNTKARELQADGSYRQVASDGPPVRSQAVVLEPVRPVPAIVGAA